MGKKVLALLLVGMLSVLTLVGCGEVEKQTEDQTQDTETALSYNGQDVSEPVELVMYYIGDPSEDQETILEEVNKILKEKINATLVLKNMSLSDYTTKYSLAIASGEDIDLMYTSTWCFYQTEATKGAFEEITDEVLQNCMPLHFEKQAKASWDQAKVGGKAYFVPVNNSYVTARAILIRGDLREKYGLEKLAGVADLEKYFAAVASDPDSGVSFGYDASQNNEIMREMIGFYGNDWVTIGGAIQNYFTYKYSENVTADDLFWIYETEEYKEYAEMMKSWADQGFWSKSAIANNTDVQEAFKNGTSASFVQNMATVGAAASAVMDTHPEWQPEIYDLTPEAHRFFGAYTGDGVAVLATSKNKERAFMALDLMKFDEEIYNLIRYGVEGVHYNKVGDDLWSPAEETSKHTDSGWCWGLKNSLYERSREDIFPDQASINNEWNEKAVEGPTATFVFDDANVKNELANLQSVYTQYVPLLDLGLVDDVETTLKEFNQKAEEAGLEKVLEEAQAQMADYLESMK